MTHKRIGNRYEIADLTADRIGRGGMGDVYRGVDRQNGRSVAIKHLKTDMLSDPELVERFNREAEALRRLNHPNIVAVLDTHQADDEKYIIMEYVGGGSLEDKLARDKQLPIPEVLTIALELADALSRAHHLNIIHRDIKPANVLLAEDGTPRLTDFGVAHLGDMARITQTGMLTGTYAYMSPEVCEGETLDTRTDIWSFGILLYEMLTGQRPFLANSLTATLTAILTRPVPDLTQHRADAPEALTSLIYRMLEKDRDRRLNSARLVGAQLEAIISGAGQITPITGSRRFDIDTATPEPVAVGPRHNLPHQPTPFVGREQEVAEVLALLADPECRLLTLVGPGGMGKTRLAVEAARRRVEAYQNGVRFVPLAPVSSPDLVATAVAEALNISFFSDDDPQGQVRQYLAEKEMLLLLDNFEHLLDSADFVTELLAGAPRLQILVTSREALNLWEEWTRPVVGMSYPDSADGARPTADRRDDWETYSALQLFVARARRARGDFSLAEELPHIIRICRLVDGMPLGIELAAAWLKMLSPEQIATEIEKSFDFLATRMRNVTERHRSLRAVFDYSWQLLTDAEKEALRHMTVFRGGFRRQAAEAIAGASLLTLTGLVNKSLLYEGETHTTPTATPGGSQQAYRYSMHELLKQYAAEKLTADTAAQAAAADAHARYYTRFLAEQEPILTGPAQKEAYDAITEELENIRLAWDWIVEQLGQEPAAAHRFYAAAESLHIFYDNRGLAPEGLQQFTVVLEKLDATPATYEWPLPLPLLRGIALSRRGLFLYRVNDWQGAQAAQQQAIDQLRPLAETATTDIDRRVQQEMAFALTYLCVLVTNQEGSEAGLRLIDEAITIYEQLDDRWGLARAINVQAINQPNAAHLQRIPIYKKSLRLARQTGDRILMGRVLHNLALSVPDPQAARRYMEENRAIQEELGSANGLMLTYSSLATVAINDGDYEAARNNLLKALHWRKEMGLLDQIGNLYASLANVYWALGDHDAARTHYETAVVHTKETGNRQLTINALCRLGQFLLETDSYESAHKYYQKAIHLLDEIQNGFQRSEALDMLGNFALDLGLYDVARTHFQNAIPHFTDAGNEAGIGWVWRNLGEIAYALGDYDAAEGWFEKSWQQHHDLGSIWAEIELWNSLGRLAVAQEEYETAVAHYRQSLEKSGENHAVWLGLQTLVNCTQLLLKQGELETALETLYFAQNHPMLVPSATPRRIRQKLTRLLEELEAELPDKVLAQTREKAENQTYETMVTAVLSALSLNFAAK